MFKDKKAQTGALVTGLVFGIAFLVIGAIIAFIVVSTVKDADLLADDRVTITVTNESSYINNTGYTLTNYSGANDTVVKSSFNIHYAFNESEGLLPAANYSLVNGVVKNATVASYNICNVSYTYQIYTVQEQMNNKLSTNLTQGVNNVSDKIPTVLLVAAIVLIMAILVLLVAAWRKMRVGGGGI